MARPRASATDRHPSNFSLSSAARIGPAYRNGALATASGGGGQCRHEASSSSAGSPHREYPGGDGATTSPRQTWQNGHCPEPHPAHRIGKKTSSTRASTARP